jgi:hypothetical protein
MRLQRSRFTHYYFHIRDEVLGAIVMRVGSFFPFQTSYYLNGHSFIEQELKRAQIGFRKTDNAFLAVDDVAALQAAADKLSAEIIRKQLDYWTLLLGPKFSAKERKQFQLSRGSRQKVSTSRCSFCSFTNGSADPSPTAAFTTGPTPLTSQVKATTWGIGATQCNVSSQLLILAHPLTSFDHFHASNVPPPLCSSLPPRSCAMTFQAGSRQSRDKRDD